MSPVRILVHRHIARWLTRKGWIEMLSRAPRPELEQAILRAAIPAAVMIFIVLDDFIGEPLTATERRALWFAGSFFLFAVVLAAFVLTSTKPSPARRIFGIVADNVANTAFLLLYGEPGAFVFGIYLFVTFGNGFRYGMLYLRISQALSVVGFLIVLYASPFWSSHVPVGIGILVALIVLPFYVGVLAERITEARERADEANRAKGRFLANVSHEMRTPLNGVIAMTDLLRETPLDESQQEIVETLSNASQLALAQIEEVLDAAKIEAGRAQIESRPFDLARLLESSVRVVAPQARYKGLAVKTAIEPSVSRWFTGDPHHLRQVLLNLLANAVKFTERGRVELVARTLRLGTEDSLVRIEVKDTGIGIPTDKLATIFEAFAQADDSITRVYGGTGLGTTIARQLVILMGGRVGVESTVGVGSTFWVEIPLRYAEPAGKGAAGDLVSGHLPASLHLTTVAGISKASRVRGARVLVAEDNSTNQRVTRLILESGGHFVTIVSNGEEALDALEQGEFDVALLDLSMPVVSGLEALKMYRFTSTNPIPVLMLSANVTTETIEQCVAAGASEFIQKPVRASNLLDAIDRAMPEGRRQHRAPTIVRPVAADEAAPKAKLIDYSTVAELAKLSRDPTFEERLLQGVQGDVAQLADRIVGGLQRQSREAVADAAHALKGAAGSVGAELLVQLASRLEKVSAQEITEQCDALIRQLGEVVQRTNAELDSYIAKKRGRAQQASSH